MKGKAAFIPVALIISLVGCSVAGRSGSSQIDADLNTIRSGYNECVNDLGADSPQCKALSDSVHQAAEQVGSAQGTAQRIKAEDAARHSMGYP